jgi:hypothetical protein
VAQAVSEPPRNVHSPFPFPFPFFPTFLLACRVLSSGMNAMLGFSAAKIFLLFFSCLKRTQQYSPDYLHDHLCARKMAITTLWIITVSLSLI